jgi:LysR family nitrogen assimilation transcriptional regulator
VAQRTLVMPSAPHALRRILEEHAAPRGHALQVLAEVDSVQTVINLVARGVADSVVPAGVPRQAGKAGDLHVAAIHAPVIRNRLVLALPAARPATRLIQGGAQVLRELVLQHFGPRG